MSASEDAITAAVLLNLNDTYTEEGIHIWWQAYRSADELGRKRMLLHLKLGAEGACS